MKANKVYFEAASLLSKGWSVLPFNSQYATKYKDIIVPAMKKGGDLNAAFAQWQTSLETYAKDQGFKVSIGS